LYTAAFNKVEGEVCVFEALDTEFGFRGISTQRLAAEDFKEMDEDDLMRKTSVSFTIAS
jgi:hypothetical protein